MLRFFLWTYLLLSPSFLTWAQNNSEQKTNNAIDEFRDSTKKTKIFHRMHHKELLKIRNRINLIYSSYEKFHRNESTVKSYFKIHIFPSIKEMSYDREKNILKLAPEHFKSLPAQFTYYVSLGFIHSDFPELPENLNWLPFALSHRVYYPYRNFQQHYQTYFFSRYIYKNKIKFSFSEALVLKNSFEDLNLHRIKTELSHVCLMRLIKSGKYKRLLLALRKWQSPTLKARSAQSIEEILDKELGLKILVKKEYHNFFHQAIKKIAFSPYSPHTDKSLPSFEELIPAQEELDPSTEEMKIIPLEDIDDEEKLEALRTLIIKKLFVIQFNAQTEHQDIINKFKHKLKKLRLKSGKEIKDIYDQAQIALTELHQLQEQRLAWFEKLTQENANINSLAWTLGSYLSDQSKGKSAAQVWHAAFAKKLEEEMKKP